MDIYHESCIFVALSKWEWRDADVLLRKKSRKIATQSAPSIYKAHSTSDLQERVLGQNSRALCLQRYKWGWVLRRDDEKYFQKASRQCLGTFNLTNFEYLWVSYDIRPCILTRQNNTKYLMLTHVYEAWSKWVQKFTSQRSPCPRAATNSHWRAPVQRESSWLGHALLSPQRNPQIWKWFKFIEHTFKQFNKQILNTALIVSPTARSTAIETTIQATNANKFN